jgi:hypothetical protein
MRGEPVTKTEARLGRREPSDEELLGALRVNAGVWTYVVRNRVDPTRLVPVSRVRYRLMKLAGRGLVRRFPTASSVHLCWALAERAP